MSTREQLRSDLRDEIRIDPNGKMWGDSVLNSYINQAIFQIQKDWNFGWRENQGGNSLFSLVSWTQEYDLPSDFIRVELVRYNGTELYKTTKNELKKQYDSFTSWSPCGYYILWTKIWFDVIPDGGNIDFDYLKRVPSLASDDDIMAFPDDFDLAVVKYASYLAWSSPRGNEQTAWTKKQEYDMIMNSLRAWYIFYDTNDLSFGVARGRQRTSARAIWY